MVVFFRPFFYPSLSQFPQFFWRHTVHHAETFQVLSWHRFGNHLVGAKIKTPGRAQRSIAQDHFKRQRKEIWQNIKKKKKVWLNTFAQHCMLKLGCNTQKSLDSLGPITHCVPGSERGQGDHWGRWSCPHRHIEPLQTETHHIKSSLSLALHRHAAQTHYICILDLSLLAQTSFV